MPRCVPPVCGLASSMASIQHVAGQREQAGGRQERPWPCSPEVGWVTRHVVTVVSSRQEGPPKRDPGQPLVSHQTQPHSYAVAGVWVAR
jgi:hypothetical protein